MRLSRLSFPLAQRKVSPSIGHCAVPAHRATEGLPPSMGIAKDDNARWRVTVHDCTNGRHAIRIGLP